ncbi:MAG TPA: hypothetical protein VGJ48_27385 [Pyrinomonadaceae bacterium]|jgi:hypothetical protein
MSVARCIQVIFLSCLLVVCSGSQAQSPGNEPRRFEKEGLAFEYGQNWELSDQSNAAAQQLVLTEKTLDAQIMIIALRSAITTDKQAEQAKAALIEPSITRLLKQYYDAAINVERLPAKTEVAGSPAEGVQLRFEVDSQPGATDIYWRVINQRLVQLFFIRPEKTVAKAAGCWDTIRGSLKIEKSAAKPKDSK